MQKRSIGFPRMHKERGEVRAFLPRLIRRLAPRAREVVVEEGYGARMGIEPEAYLEAGPNVRFGTHQACYEQDIVVQVRSPEDDEMAGMKPGAILFSMLHFNTHPGRVRRMQDLGLIPIAMDGVVDDDGVRLIENIRGTSWNAIWAGFRALRKTRPNFFEPPYDVPIRVLIVGAGPVGRYAAEAAAKHGGEALTTEPASVCVTPVIATLIERSVTCNEALLTAEMRRADMFVDATARRDPSRYIFRNELLGYLPAHAVVVDLAADPYLNLRPGSLQVKAIEGIPTGDLDKYEFPPDDPAFDALPPEVDTTHRRMTVSCYSWPGLKPLACMKRYGRQVQPFLEILLQKPVEMLSLETGDYFERALVRGTLRYWLEREKGNQS
ncbi:MAG: alanine dehydrogenase [Anaerolineae bacterium]